MAGLTPSTVLQLPRETVYVVASCSAGATTTVIPTSNQRIRLFSLEVSNANTNNHVVYFTFNSPSTNLFKAYVESGVTIYRNLIGAECMHGIAGTKLDCVVDSGGTGSIYVTVGYEIVQGT